MSQLVANIRAESGSHWYTPDGKPFYQIENSSKPGTMRNVTLRDARRVGLYPSVTSVLSIVEKSGLNRWKLEQAVLSAITLPRLDSETDDQFARRVSEDMSEESRKAVDFGSRLHEAIEHYIIGGLFEPDDEIKPFVDAFAAWHKVNAVDFIDCVADFKTQGKDPWDALVFYPEWCWQLAAYQRAIEEIELQPGMYCELPVSSKRHGYGGRVDYIARGVAPMGCVSIAISSKVPGHIAAKRWDDDEVAEGWSVFEAALELWKRIKGYDPTKGEPGVSESDEGTM